MKPSRIQLLLYCLLFGLANTWEAMSEQNIVGKATKDPDRLRLIVVNPRQYTGKPRVGTMRELMRVMEIVHQRLGEVHGNPILAYRTSMLVRNLIFDLSHPFLTTM
ncbi:hypothetical protein KSP40_PGU016945 [Platanthera guangdongensis]|uniref:Uncharacterized protein n=1 Tax=Platanthera guangdongensis TaxID=2320717 RepID=A0ABR2MN07_9ASPA